MLYCAPMHPKGALVSRLPADTIGQVAARLFDSAELDLPNPLVYANFSRQCDPARRRSLLSRNTPRRIRVPPLNLLRYPQGTLVNGDRSYLTVAGDAVVHEQVAPWCADWEDEAARMRAASPVDIAPPCLLLARFGENTWGHWVTEMLAKAAIAERLAPGRFHYAVPWWTTEAGHPYAERVLESLAAYGILADRLVRLAGFKVYRFAALHDVASLAVEALHPGALESLAHLHVPLPAGPAAPKIAMLRRPPLARALANPGEIQGFLKASGFATIDPAELSFLEQIRHVAGADLIVGGLGSDFWAIPFGRPGLSLVSLAPSAWDDGYFVHLFQRDGGDPVRSSHLIDPAELDRAMQAAMQPETPDVVVDTEAMPRRLGPERLHLLFGQGGNAAPCLRGDWSAPEPAHTWSLGPTSEIVIPASLLSPGEAYWLAIEGQGHVYPPHLPTRPVTVRINGHAAQSFDLIGRTRLFCQVPATAAPLVLALHHPVCPSPRSMGAGADDRALGFGFESIRFYSKAK
jgi:hypothetical protein